MRRTDTAAERDRRSQANERADTRSSDDRTGRSEPLEALHAAVGNQGVAALHERGDLQPRLAVSRPTDPAEREAERVAREVTAVVDRTDERAAQPRQDRGTADAATTDREPGPFRVSVDRRSDSTGATATVGRGTEAGIRSLRGGGDPLPATTRTFFEDRFGRDFSDVRVHAGPAADAAARSIDAEAFTLGTDIAFARGNYRPGTDAGSRLLAHELTHVVQQSGPGNDGRADRQGSFTRRPERGASLAEVKSYLACTVCRPSRFQVCAHDLSDRVLRMLLAAGWRPDVYVNPAMANAAQTIVAVDEQVAHDDAIQTYLKVEFLVENAEVVQGHMGDKQLSYPGNRPEFNTFYEQLGDEVLKAAIGELLPLSDAAGFALDVGLALYGQYVAGEDLQEDAIRDTIITRLNDELDENVRALYREGARKHLPLKQRREFARRLLWDLPGTTQGYDGPQVESAIR